MRKKKCVALDHLLVLFRRKDERKKLLSLRQSCDCMIDFLPSFLIDICFRMDERDKCPVDRDRSKLTDFRQLANNSAGKNGGLVGWYGLQHHILKSLIC